MVGIKETLPMPRLKISYISFPVVPSHISRYCQLVGGLEGLVLAHLNLA